MPRFLQLRVVALARRLSFLPMAAAMAGLVANRQSLLTARGRQALWSPRAKTLKAPAAEAITILSGPMANSWMSSATTAGMT